MISMIQTSNFKLSQPLRLPQIVTLTYLDEENQSTIREEEVVQAGEQIADLTHHTNARKKNNLVNHQHLINIKISSCKLPFPFLYEGIISFSFVLCYYT